jgi:hypothetical protein
MKNNVWGDKLWNLPWLVRLLVAIFLDFAFGLCRFIDGLSQGNLLKVVLGFVWIFYGLAIGWVLDIICCALNIRPLFL